MEVKRTFTYPVKGLDFTANETLAELKKSIRGIDGVTAAEFDYVEKEIYWSVFGYVQQGAWQILLSDDPNVRSISRI